MDAVTLIKNDHQTVEQLFARLEGSVSDEEKVELMRDVIRELSIHASIEEQFLYPAVKRAVPDGESLVDEGIDEHQEVKEVLSDLDGMAADDPEFDAKARSLMQDVRHHVEEEEGEILPKLASAMQPQELLELGERMESAKDSAPTRPHPRAPSRPPANIVAGAMAGVVDRARDAARDRLEERREARKGGAKRPTSKKSTAKPAAKKSTAKKTSAKKTTARKTTPRKTTAKKTSARKTTAKKTTARKTTARGPVIHVTPDKAGGWRAATRGAGRAVARGDKKSEVVRRARDAAKARSGRLVIHDSKGKIQDERTYGPDPRRSKG